MNYDEKTFGDFARDLWGAKFAMLLFALIGLGCALLWIALATPYYKATMIVAPASPMNGAEIAPPSSGDDIFALRYLVQRLGVSNSSDFQFFENVFDGPSVAKELVSDQRVVAGVAEDTLFAFLPPRERKTPEDLAEYFAKKIRIEPVGNTQLRRLVYYHPDRDYAVYALGRLHEIADALIRKRIREEADQRVRYLNDAIARTDNPDHRRALTALLLEQERLRMLVSIDQPYAASIVEPPSADTRPDRPDAVLLIAAFMLGGAFIGYIVHGLGRR